MSSFTLPDTRGPYEARVCKGIPAACCDYGVVSLSEGREVCRVWREQDARAIAAALSTPAASTPAGWSVRGAQAYRLFPDETEAREFAGTWGLVKPVYDTPPPAQVTGEWQPIETVPTAVGHARTTGICKDDDKLTWWENGNPTHWMPLPASPTLTEPTEGR